jgi:hypothetical protein
MRLASTTMTSPHRWSSRIKPLLGEPTVDGDVAARKRPRQMTENVIEVALLDRIEVAHGSNQRPTDEIL